MAMRLPAAGADRQLRRARLVGFAALATGTCTSLVFPLWGLRQEPSPLWQGLGVAGVLAFAAGCAGALYAALTPWLDPPRRRLLLIGFAAAAVLSVPLVGLRDHSAWTWMWLGASVVGSAPLLGRRRWGLTACAATLAAAVLVGLHSGAVFTTVVFTVVAGGGIALISRLQVWFWDLLLQAREGQLAQAKLAAAEERLRFSRDVHDLLGHSLSVIALKAELAARLATVDAERAGREAAEVQRLAASALGDVHDAVHGYRDVDFADQLASIGQVLRSCGIRCTVTTPGGPFPPEFAAVLREACTNVLRHSRAAWCDIELTREGDTVRLTITNDGAPAAGRPAGTGYGLRGLTERLAAVGGTLTARTEDGVFTLVAGA